MMLRSECVVLDSNPHWLRAETMVKDVWKVWHSKRRLSASGVQGCFICIWGTGVVREPIEQPVQLHRKENWNSFENHPEQSSAVCLRRLAQTPCIDRL